MLGTTDINKVFTDKHGVHKMYSSIIVTPYNLFLRYFKQFPKRYLICFNFLILIIRVMTITITFRLNHLFEINITSLTSTSVRLILSVHNQGV